VVGVYVVHHSSKPGRKASSKTRLVVTSVCHITDRHSNGG
jgi:hypothetical protein